MVDAIYRYDEVVPIARIYTHLQLLICRRKLSNLQQVSPVAERLHKTTVEPRDPANFLNFNHW